MVRPPISSARTNAAGALGFTTPHEMRPDRTGEGGNTSLKHRNLESAGTPRRSFLSDDPPAAGRAVAAPAVTPARATTGSPATPGVDGAGYTAAELTVRLLDEHN